MDSAAAQPHSLSLPLSLWLCVCVCVIITKWRWVLPAIMADIEWKHAQVLKAPKRKGKQTRQGRGLREAETERDRDRESVQK